MEVPVEDRFDFATYNRVLWKGLVGNKPYPAVSSGLDLRHKREEILRRQRQSRKQKTAEAPKVEAK